MEKMKNIITGVLSGTMLLIAVQVGQASEPGVNSSISSIDDTESQLSFDIANFQTDTAWFSVDIIGPDDEDPEDQQVTDQPTNQTPSGDCDPENQGEVCSVGLDISGVTDQEAYEELLDRIDDETMPNPTIQEFLDIGATFLDDARELTPN